MKTMKLRVLCLMNCINKSEGNSSHVLFLNNCLYLLSCRQKDVQRQLEKISNLLRLIVQKMEIHTEIDNDNATQDEKHESFAKMRKFRNVFHATRRFARAPTLSGNVSSLFNQSEKV